MDHNLALHEAASPLARLIATQAGVWFAAQAMSGWWERLDEFFEALTSA